ncbi:MAG: sugar transferase [Gemmatimonas sp.]|nr:sugar transferase [Gemmatimonas sp.]
MNPAVRPAPVASETVLSYERPFSKNAANGIHREHAVEQAGPSNTRLRRGVNLALALIGLILLAPVMLLVALLIRGSSPGPIIYKQTRVGIDRRRGGSANSNWRRSVDYGGKLFTIYKFRTMRADPASAIQIWAHPDDDRITPIGRILRKYRLDELPQLFNVLRGDMNIVGPRPEQPKIFMELREKVPEYSIRQRVLPGITGWAQINHPYDQSVEDVKKKVAYDLEYLENESILFDLWIVLQTVPVMVFRKGAV